MKKEFIIKEEDNGRKIFKIIKKNIKELQLGDIQKIFRKKDIKINGKRSKQDEIANIGDKISVFIGGELEKKFEKNKNFIKKSIKNGKILDKNKKISIPEKYFKENFKIIYEDDDILVADKPAGLAVHPGSNHLPGKTMICLAKFYLEQKNPGGDNFIQLAHRLDADTSGVLLFAKKSDSLRKVNEEIKKRKVEKKYFALIKGEIKTELNKNGKEKNSGKIICLVKRVNTNKKPGGNNSGNAQNKVILAKKGDKDALISQTNFKIVKKIEAKIGNKSEKFSLLDLNIKTGRMHQIRVHMESKGTPLVMDQMYGDFGFNKNFKKEIGLKRHFLHSYFFEITHPKTGKKIEFKSELSDDLKTCLNKIEK